MNINPEKEHGIVSRVTNSHFAFHGWPSICRDEKGTLYVVASGFRRGHIAPDGKTVMYISHNEGRKWSPPIVINDSYLDDRDAGILYMGNGRMLVTWFSLSAEYYEKDWPDVCERIPREHSAGGSYIKISEDYGFTWSEPIKLPGSAPHGPNMLKDGTLIYLAKDMYRENSHVSMGGYIRSYKSTDGGYTWTETAVIDIVPGTEQESFHEPHVVELSDGRLLGAIRGEGDRVPYGFTIYTTVSEDKGDTWSMPKCTNVCGSPPHLLMHSSGALICSYGHRVEPLGERAMVSYDLGKTWQDDYELHTIHTGYSDLGYPCSVEMDDGSIFTVYYQQLEGDVPCCLQYTRWKLKKE